MDKAMMQPLVTGTEFNYYNICRRKLWLFSHGIQMEHTSDNVLLGKMIDDFNRTNMELKSFLGSMFYILCPKFLIPQTWN